VIAVRALPSAEQMLLVLSFLTAIVQGLLIDAVLPTHVLYHRTIIMSIPFPAYLKNSSHAAPRVAKVTSKRQTDVLIVDTAGGQA
jgi:hypothetical protein